MEPSCILTCSTALEETSTKNLIKSFVVSIVILLRGVTKPASPIRPITGPSATVPLWACPVSR